MYEGQMLSANTQAAPPEYPQAFNQRAAVLSDAQMPTAPISPNKSRQITIREISRGYIVDVGCQSFAFESAATVIAKISEYLNNPEATEKKWFDGKLF
jgi:hypothetical protein